MKRLTDEEVQKILAGVTCAGIDGKDTPAARMKADWLRARAAEPKDHGYDLKIHEVQFWNDKRGKGLVIRWVGPGFGNFYMWMDGTQLCIDSECMSDDFLQALMQELLRKCERRD